MGAQLWEHRRAHVLSGTIQSSPAHNGVPLFHLGSFICQTEGNGSTSSPYMASYSCIVSLEPSQRGWVCGIGQTQLDVLPAVISKPLQGCHIEMKTANNLLPYLRRYMKPFWRQDEGDINRNNRLRVAVKFSLICGLWKSKNTMLLFSLLLTVSIINIAFLSSRIIIFWGFLQILTLI